jgi:hypothetical protein
VIHIYAHTTSLWIGWWTAFNKKPTCHWSTSPPPTCFLLSHSLRAGPLFWIVGWRFESKEWGGGGEGKDVDMKKGDWKQLAIQKKEASDVLCDLDWSVSPVETLLIRALRKGQTRWRQETKHTCFNTNNLSSLCQSVYPCLYPCLSRSAFPLCDPESQWHEFKSCSLQRISSV